ncbi:stage V sporulation protein AB [Paludifilum halophilum]|uniref:Stage V sporulation protein AB n=2 Tax=Paludifilum halophilum TaxID=1642702 RepID=A0A235BCG7_9BACL|nr:stage V sporulation protein AB [Paludifilum halophilum]
MVVGLAGGLAVGSGFVAFLTVLDVIPRLTVMSRAQKVVPLYEYALIFGALISTWVDFRGWSASLIPISAVPVGALAGCFVGLLAAALTEVINVLPILAKRMGLKSRIMYLLMAMVIGKVVGSLFQWILF